MLGNVCAVSGNEPWRRSQGRRSGWLPLAAEHGNKAGVVYLSGELASVPLCEEWTQTLGVKVQLLKVLELLF